MSEDAEETDELEYAIEKRGGFTGLPQLAFVTVFVVFAILRGKGLL